MLCRGKFWFWKIISYPNCWTIWTRRWESAKHCSWESALTSQSSRCTCMWISLDKAGNFTSFTVVVNSIGAVAMPKGLRTDKHLDLFEISGIFGFFCVLVHESKRPLCLESKPIPFFSMTAEQLLLSPFWKWVHAKTCSGNWDISLVSTFGLAWGPGRSGCRTLEFVVCLQEWSPSLLAFLLWFERESAVWEGLCKHWQDCFATLVWGTKRSSGNNLPVKSQLWDEHEKIAIPSKASDPPRWCSG